MINGREHERMVRRAIDADKIAAENNREMDQCKLCYTDLATFHDTEFFYEWVTPSGLRMRAHPWCTPKVMQAYATKCNIKSAKAKGWK